MSTQPGDEDLTLDRLGWSMDNCSVAGALDLVGSRSAWLLLREAFMGTRRFADFAERTGLSEPVAAKWLRQLTTQGLLERQAYREAGQRAREDYALTAMGGDLMTAIGALREWGDRYAVPETGPALVVRHAGCGSEVHAVLRCEAGHDVGAEDMAMTAGPGLMRTDGASTAR